MLDLVFRLERTFGIKMSREELSKMLGRNKPPDITVGEMFDFVSRKALLAGTFDEEMDTGSLWPVFERDVSDALGVDLCEVTKDRWLIHDLGRV